MAGIVYFGKRTCIRFLNKDTFAAATKQVLQEHKKKLQRLAYVFVTDDALLSINQEHLQHDYYTDIITFDLSDDPKILDAEIYISYERVMENAQTHGILEDEFLRVMFHGMLHLCGYADKSTAEQKQMRLKETQCVNLYRRLTGI